VGSVLQTLSQKKVYAIGKYALLSSVLTFRFHVRLCTPVQCQKNYIYFVVIQSNYLIVRFRVKDLIENGMSRYIVDPEDEAIKKLSEKVVETTLKGIPLPLLNNWTTNLTNIPEKFSYISIYEYLIKRSIKVFRSCDPADSDNEHVNKQETIVLPSAEKPLRKGYNFFASGHVDDLKLNPLEKITHVKATVLSSMKQNKYKASVVLDKSSGLVLSAKCDCVAGMGGKCNHVAAILFFCLDFQHQLRHQSPSKTEKLQEWHQPSRKAKKNTKPTKTGIVIFN